jgi:hypothetical protein
MENVNTPSFNVSSVNASSGSNKIYDNVNDFTNRSWNLSGGTILRYFGIILILSILGLNLFSYLGIATEFISKITAPILKLFGVAVAETTKTAAVVGAAGVKAGANVVAGGADVVSGAVVGGVNVLENTLSSGITRNNIDDNSLVSINKALRNAEKNMTLTPMPDDTSSEIQRSRLSGKSGYCLIGQDKGFRTCVNVNESDQCMSGEIFPTREICINPNLRQ